MDNQENIEANKDENSSDSLSELIFTLLFMFVCVLALLFIISSFIYKPLVTISYIIITIIVYIKSVRNKQTRLLEVKDGKIKELFYVEGLHLIYSEKCYVAENVLVFDEGDNLITGMFYITSNRVILTAGEKSFDKLLEQVVCIEIEDDSNLIIQFKSDSYKINIINPILYKLSIEYLSHQKNRKIV